MNSENNVKYAVYDLHTFFSWQPTDIRWCPICRCSLSKANIAPSQAALDDITASKFLIAIHDFTRLYTCGTCHWWAIWESWGYYECNSQADYLIVVEERSRIFDVRNQQDGPWSEILQNTFIYDRVKALPEALGQLFIGGKRADPKIKIGSEDKGDSL